MALTWDLTNINDHDNVCFIGEGDERQLNPVTNALIWSTMGVGIGRITEDNAAEFYARLHIIERINGAMLVGPDGPVFLTMEDVRNHIGLTCNVSYETRQEWALRHIVGHGDSLKSYGEKRMTEDERYEHADREQGLLRTCGDVLFQHGNANVARIGQRLHDEADHFERFGRSMTDDLARMFRQEQEKAKKEATA